MFHPDGRIMDAGEIVEAEPTKTDGDPLAAPEQARAQGRRRVALHDGTGTHGAAVKLSITHTIEREPSKLIEAVSGGWPKVISNLKSLLETGSTVLQVPYPVENDNSGKE